MTTLELSDYILYDRDSNVKKILSHGGRIQEEPMEKKNLSQQTADRLYLSLIHI